MRGGSRGATEKTLRAVCATTVRAPITIFSSCNKHAGRPMDTFSQEAETALFCPKACRKTSESNNKFGCDEVLAEARQNGCLWSTIITKNVHTAGCFKMSNTNTNSIYRASRTDSPVFGQLSGSYASPSSPGRSVTEAL